jgi:uncharacterized membrane protein
MAGIGFHLDRLSSRDTFQSDVATATGAGFVFIGPWIFCSLANLALYFHSVGKISEHDRMLLFSTLTYSYAGAMIFTSFLTFPVTRYLADQIYAERLECIGPTVIATWVVHLLGTIPTFTLFYTACKLPGAIQLLGIMIGAAATTQIWLAGSFISMLRSYLPVSLSFLFGYILATVAGALLGARFGLYGYLLGYWIGLAFVAMSLTIHLMLRFAFPQPMDFRFLKSLPQQRYLLLVGFCLAAGIWADKIVFWMFGPATARPAAYLRTYPPYDVAFTIGMLSILPGMAWILLSIETTFARSARHVFTALSNHEPYSSIERGKVEVLENMQAIFWGLMKVQAPVTLPLLIFTDLVADAIGFPHHMVHIIRFSFLSSLATLLIQAHTLYLLYFDLPRQASLPVVVFFVGNVVLSYISIQVGYSTYGLGNLVASYAAVLVGGLMLNRVRFRLEFHVMVRTAAVSITK